MVLVFAESQKGNFKKAAFEAVTYGYKTAQLLGTNCVALALGTANNAADLGLYGASKVLHVADTALDQFDSQVYAKVIAEASQQVGAKVIGACIKRISTSDCNDEENAHTTELMM